MQKVSAKNGQLLFFSFSDLINYMLIKPAHNSTYPKVAAQWLKTSDSSSSVGSTSTGSRIRQRFDSNNEWEYDGRILRPRFERGTEWEIEGNIPIPVIAKAAGII